jgi:hypothetical protein
MRVHSVIAVGLLLLPVGVWVWVANGHQPQSSANIPPGFFLCHDGQIRDGNACVSKSAQFATTCDGSGPLRAGNVYEQTKDGCLALIGRSATE